MTQLKYLIYDAAVNKFYAAMTIPAIRNALDQGLCTVVEVYASATISFISFSIFSQ